MSKWNGKRFSVYTSDEKSALGLIKKLGEQTNYNTDELEQVKLKDSKKVTHEEMQEIYKIDKDANFTGSWHGIKKPTASQEGLQATVDKIVEEDIPNIKGKIESNINKSYNVILKHDNFLNTEEFICRQLTNKDNINQNFSLTNNKFTSDSNSTILIPKATLCDGYIEFVCENPILSSWFGVCIGFDILTNKGLCFILRNNILEMWELNGTNFSNTGIYKDLGIDIYCKVFDNSQVCIKLEKIGNKVNFFINDRLVYDIENNLTITYNGYNCGIISNSDTSFIYKNLSLIEYTYDSITDLSKGVCVGDSITFGVNQGDWNWIWHLKDKIKNNLYNESNIINEGHSGYTTSQLKELIGSIIINNPNLKFAIVGGGMNDSKTNNGLTYIDTVNNLKQIIRTFKQYGITPIIKTITPLLFSFGSVGSENVWDKTSWEHICIVNNEIRKMAKKEHIRLIDDAKTFGTISTENLKAIIDDGVHPNSKGAEILGENAFITIK